MRLTIGIPYSGAACGVSPSWVAALRQLVVPADHNIHFVKGTPLDVARNYVVERALADGSDYVFFIDADVVPKNPLALQLLLSLRLPVVSGFYVLRKNIGGEFRANAFKLRDGRYEALRLGELPPTWVFEVDGVGAGFLLVAREVFERLGKPWFKWEADPEEGGLSEDLYFCDRVRRELGLEIYVTRRAEAYHVLAPGLALDVDGRVVNDVL